MKLFLLFVCWNVILGSTLNFYDTRYFFCNNRIYMDNNLIRLEDINLLCNAMTRDDRFVILFTQSMSYRDEQSYLINSENFYTQYCISTSKGCDNGFAVSIYLKGGKVIITSGRKSKTIVTVNQRTNVINSMIPYLSNGEYYQGLYLGINSLSKYYAANGGGRYDSGTKSSSVGGAVKFLFFLVIICACVFCCYYYYHSQKEEEDKLVYENTEVIPNNNFSNASNANADKIHMHLSFLEEIINQIRLNDPQMKTTDCCLICMQHILNTPGILESTTTRFGCQHLYHNTCLTRHNLNFCLMCEEQGDLCRSTQPNNYNTQVLYENNVKNFIKNLFRLYQKQDIIVYTKVYKEEYNNFNDGLMLGLLASTWMMPHPMYYGPGYYGGGGYYPPQYYGDGNVYSNNNYNSDPNPDSAVGNFNAGNIEMQNINSNNYDNNMGGFNDYSNNTGNFNSNYSNNTGNFNNNYDNNTGDFGGGDSYGGGDYGDF